ncbi:hypothetical protein EASAB2608_08066 [Streptomyces sp. EAS-AB2608]|uniref:Uncharacterized protein n=1 Tax=Streptomyces bangladeshensis TaxID=295352 RepID=A0ABP5NDR0_9ACTN|nr:hypothetical protein EASAB2608_08066 [Streptomyces sp. EAS-AB2608]CUW33019.1 hypothetical protein TUE45_pSRTUE45c_0387 [Streptomyces reticuli]
MTEKKPSPTTLPLQAPPIVRAEGTDPAVHASGQGVEAAVKCSQLTGVARQMCLASRGIRI